MNYSRDLRRLMRQQRIETMKHQLKAGIKPTLWMCAYLLILLAWVALP